MFEVSKRQKGSGGIRLFSTIRGRRSRSEPFERGFEMDKCPALRRSELNRSDGVGHPCWLRGFQYDFGIVEWRIWSKNLLRVFNPQCQSFARY